MKQRRSPLFQPESPFDTFWMAGYEGADHINGSGTALDMVASTQHAERVDEDYRALRRFGIATVRESVGWRLVEAAGCFDFSSVQIRIDAARRHGIQIAWTLCHYGWPPDVDLFDDSWISRFAWFCHTTASYVAAHSHGVPIYTPINEISFLAWAACETGLIHPYQGNRAADGYDVKKRLVRGAIAGTDAIWAVDPRARILTVDPMIHMVAPAGRLDLVHEVARQRSYQFQAWDMLSGLSEPSLGGSRRYLGVLGINYYHDNQWEHGSQSKLHWHLRDVRRVPLRDLMREAYWRYQVPMVLAETSHVGEGRGEWISEIGEEVAAVLAEKLPLQGVCIYPAIDRPDWETPGHWHHSGLWNVEPEGPDRHRSLCQHYADALRGAQGRVRTALSPTPDPTPSFFNWSKPVPCLIVFCHLRWDFVYQRPQHLISRFAEHGRVYFVEEPVHDAGPAFLEASSPCANVTVLRPHTPVQATGFHADQMPALRALLADMVENLDLAPYWMWFYTPMAMPLLEGFEPEVVVYDCMDELSAFAHAPVALRTCESDLMAAADIVFMGGPSLFEAKRHQHAAAYCFPSAVDVRHFAQGRDVGNAHALLSGLPHPRLGFFGVVDERFDIALLATLADARPQWTFCIVGPVVKIDPATLPRHSNIRYFGQQAYADLPAFVAGWDVCLMPFARNASTRFISPTKTLEYMAAGKPVVSTAIQDVFSLYGDIVSIAHSPAEFLAACEAALHEDASARALRLTRMAERVASVSWDATVSEMLLLIHGVIAARNSHDQLLAPTEAAR